MNETASIEPISSEQIHRHSFWLYSVIVGLSVEEALRHVLPHVGELSFEMTLPDRLNVTAEFVRLATFLLLVVRFYLGSVRFFLEAHISDVAHHDYPNKNYTYDFFIGLVHFSAFLALSLSIDSQKLTSSLFLFWLGFILLYDWVWFWICRKYDTSSIVRFWAYLNGATFILSMLLYLAASKIPEVSPEWNVLFCEIAFFLPVLFFSFLDLREVLSSTPVFRNWVINLVSPKKKALKKEAPLLTPAEPSRPLPRPADRAKTK